LLAGTLSTAAQPNITSTGTLSSLIVSGNINAGNISSPSGTITANLFSGNANSLSNIPAANIVGTVTSATNAAALLQNTSTATTVYPTFSTSSANGNSSAVINTGISANLGNASITATTFVGALSGTATSATTAATVTTNAQPNITSVGTLSALLVTNKVTAGQLQGDGGNISNIQGGNVSGAVSSATTAGTVTTAAQPNITSVGTLTGLTLAANADITMSGTGSNINGVALVSATLFEGSGANLTNLNASNVSSGTLAQARLANASLTLGNTTLTLGGTTTTVAGLSSVTSTTFVGALTGAATTAATVTTNAQPNITSVGTLTSLSVTGNISAGNVSATTFTGALTGAATTAGTVTTAAQPNITSVGTLTGLTLAANSDITMSGTDSNINGVALVSATLFAGSGANLTNLNGSNISSGTIAQARLANASVTLGSTALTLGSTVTTVAGLTSVTSTTFVGALTGAATTAGTVTTAAQPNITSVGTLTSLNSSGTITAPAFTANTGVFTGNGSGLSAIAGANVTGTVSSATTAASATTAGTVTTAAQGNITSLGTLTGLGVNGTVTAANITANTGVFTGNGSALTALNASNVSSGTLAQARLANSNVVLGSTTLALGSTTTTIAGLSSVTSTTFVGALTGAATTAGTVTTAAQGNITSLGTLTGLGVNGTITGVNITANSGVFTGNGSGLSAIAGANVSGTVSSATTAGTVTTAAQPNITSVGTLTSLTVSGNISTANVTASGYHIRSVNTGISAAGSTQGTATAITREINVVSTVASGAGVVFPTAVAGMVITITNTSANALLVYPATSARINSAALNAAYSQPAGSTLQFIAPTTTQWYTVGATFA
jgi:hypothetical protein